MILQPGRGTIVAFVKAMQANVEVRKACFEYVVVVCCTRCKIDITALPYEPFDARKLGSVKSIAQKCDDPIDTEIVEPKDMQDMPEHPNDLRNHNCLIYSQSPKADTWAFKEKDGEDIGVKVKGNLRSDAGKLLLGAALNGQGVLIGPTYMLAKAMKEGQLETALKDYYRPSTGLFAIYPHSKLVSSKVRAFVDYLAEAWTELA